MTEWNFDMSTAPKGEMRKELRTIGKNQVEVEVYVSVPIFVAMKDGKTITPSKWIPQGNRWNMFTAEAPPIAWLPWPVHPELE